MRHFHKCRYEEEYRYEEGCRYRFLLMNDLSTLVGTSGVTFPGGDAICEERAFVTGHVHFGYHSNA